MTAESIFANWVITASASETREINSAGVLHCLPTRERLFRPMMPSSMLRSGKVQSVTTIFCVAECIRRLILLIETWIAQTFRSGLIWQSTDFEFRPLSQSLARRDIARMVNTWTAGHVPAL